MSHGAKLIDRCKVRALALVWVCERGLSSAKAREGRLGWVEVEVRETIQMLWVRIYGGFRWGGAGLQASVGMLVMPEPDVVVGHGDANLDLNDFFSRAPEEAAPS